MLKLKRAVRDYLWLYLLIAFAVILGWNALFNALDRIRDNEQLTLGVYNTDCDTQALREALNAALPERTEQKLLALYVDDITLSPEDDRFRTKLTMQVLQSDLVILPESLVQSVEIGQYFLPLPEALIPEEPTLRYYADGECYGAVLAPQTSFAAYCTQTEPCYLFVSPQTVNLAGLLGRGEEADDAAAAVFRYLTEVNTP